MDASIYFLMFSFSLAMSISPGPVNIAIVASGINHGFKKTFAFISGATIGFTLLLILTSLGLSKVYEQYASAFIVLELLGALFICYVGYKIASSKGTIQINEKDKKYLKFYEGFLLQWLNPKAWIACISGGAMFYKSTFDLIVFIVMYFFVCYLSLSFWGVLGQKVTYFLNTNRRLELFNIFMGVLLIFCALLIIVSSFIE